MVFNCTRLRFLARAIRKGKACVRAQCSDDTDVFPVSPESTCVSRRWFGADPLWIRGCADVSDGPAILF